MGPWPKDASGWTQVSGDFCIPHEVPSSALHAAEKRHVPRGPSLAGRWRTHLQPLGCCCCSSIKACPTLCDPLDRSTPGSSVLRYLPGVCSNSGPTSWCCHGNCFKIQWSVEASSPEGRSAGLARTCRPPCPGHSTDCHERKAGLTRNSRRMPPRVRGPQRWEPRPDCPLPEEQGGRWASRGRTESRLAFWAPPQPVLLGMHLQTGFCRLLREKPWGGGLCKLLTLQS